MVLSARRVRMGFQCIAECACCEPPVVAPRLGAVSCGIRCRMCVCLYGNSTACRCLGWAVVGNMRVVGRWGNIWAVRVEVITHKSTATVGTSFTQTAILALGKWFAHG